MCKTVVNVEAALVAYFKQYDGSSLPGVDWRMSLSSAPTIKFLVRSYFSSNTPTEEEQTVLMQCAVDFISHRVAKGWVPNQGEFIEMEKEA